MPLQEKESLWFDDIEARFQNPGKISCASASAQKKVKRGNS